MPLLTAAAFFGGMTSFAPGLQIAKRTGLVGLVVVCFGVLNAVLAFVLFDPMGIKGPALGYLIGCAGGFAVLMVLSQRTYHVAHAWRRIVPTTVAITGLVALARIFLAGSGEAASVLGQLGIAAAGLALIGARLLDRGELNLLGRLPRLAGRALRSPRHTARLLLHELRA